MRRTLLILCLFLLAALPVEASEGRHAEWVDDPILPDVQWNASVDIGYISTAPLVKDGLVIVKGGGSSTIGGAGLVAYRADTGVEIWRTIHTASVRGFEVAPLLHIAGSSSATSTCNPTSDLVITGWTSGQLTAHNFTTGEELWNQSTDAPNWGITGGGFAMSSGHVVWPTETGIIQVCANNGTIHHLHQDSSLRTYRAGLGIWYEWASDENGSITTTLGWLQGTESGHVLRYGADSTLMETIDIVSLANLSGTWRIRSTPISISDQSVLLHLHADGESRLIRLGWNSSGEPDIIESISMGSGTATTPAGMGYLSTVAGTNGAVHYGILNGTLFETIRWNASNVVGEIGWIQWGEVTAICLPQNSAQGSWYIAIDANHTLEWIPDQPGYLTAGCGSDGDVHAAANDASWLEVRYDPADWNSIHDSADETLGTIPEPEPEPEPEIEQEQSIETTDKNLGIIWLPFIGSAIFLIIAQFAMNSETRRMIQIGAILMVMLGLIMTVSVYNSEIVGEPVEDSSDRLRISSVIPQLENSLEVDEVLVTIHFSETYAPDDCSEGEVRLYETGDSWLLSPVPENSYCVLVAMIPIEAGETVEDVTLMSFDELGLNFEIEQMSLGSFLQDIGDAEGGLENQWWTYDLNGGYGTVGMAEQVVEPGDEVGWFFESSDY